MAKTIKSAGWTIPESIKKIADRLTPVEEAIFYIIVTILVIIGGWCKDGLYDWWHSESMTEQSLLNDSNRDIKIHQLITEMRVLLNADRSYIFRFHNGGYWKTGEPMKKMSCAYESVSAGVSSEQAQLQDILLTRVPEVLQAVSGMNPEVIQVSDLRDTYFKQMLISEGVDTVVLRSLYKDGNIIGYIAADYINGQVDQPDLSILNAYAEQCELLI